MLSEAALNCGQLMLQPPSEVGATITFHEALYWASVTLSTVGYGRLADVLLILRLQLEG